jgi:hypothetical protein
MDKEFNDLLMEIPIKVIIKMESHLDMDNIIGSLGAFLKVHLNKA